MTPDNVLRQILTAVSTEDNWEQTIAPWLESSLGDGTRIPDKYVGLQPSLSDGTRIRQEYVDLQPFDMSKLRLSQSFVDGPQAKILVSSKGESLPVLAILWRSPDGQWRLRSFEFQCPVCFGTGVLGNHIDWEICDACGGSGWGGRY
jgi:hypothetical protein